MKRLFLLFVLCGLFVGCEEFLPTTQSPNSGNNNQLPNSGNNNTNEEHSCPLVFDIESEGRYIIDVAPEGREVDIKIRTNVEYGFSIPSDAKSWISITGTRADVSERGVTFEVAENTSTEARETVILFTQKDGELLYAVHFRQFGVPTVDDIFKISGQGSYTIDVEAEGDMKYLNVTTNCGCNVVIPEESRYWLSLAESRTEPAAESRTLAFVIAENLLADERKATVELQDNNGRVMFEVTFRQKGNDAEAPIFKIAKVESYEASPNGGKVHIAVTTNIDYSVNIASGAQSWLSVADTRSELSVGVVTLVAEKNDTNAKRSGVVTFKDMDGNTLESVTISQEISNFDIVVENAEGLVCMPGASVNIAYSIVGGGSNPKVEAFGDSGWSAEVSATSADKGSIKVTAPEGASSGKIVILAISTTGQSITKSIYFNEGVLTGIVDTYTVDYAACTLKVTLKTNLEYSVNIPTEAQSWISVADTRASLRSETLTFTIAENPDDMPRNAIIELVGECNDVLQKFTIAQKLQPSGDYIEFADQYVKKVCVQKYDKNGDGELSYKEAAEVTSIPGYFFGDYDKTVTSFNELQYFTKVTKFDSYAFSGCSNLKSIAIPEKVNSIGYAAFVSCSSLKSVYITDLSAWCKISYSSDFSNPLYTAGGDLYINGELATEITIPSDITTLKSYVFYNCDSLTKVVIPDSVTSIGERAFYDCDTLENVTIPNSVTSIDTSAFYDCDALESITIPNSVTSIGTYAFYSCDALESVTLPENITKIDSYTFSYCKSLKSITIPDNVVKIGSEAFHDCDALESVTIGSGVTAIDNYAFCSCNSLKRVTIDATLPPTLGSDVFYAHHIGFVVYVPESAYNTYQSNEYWKEFDYLLRYEGFERPAYDYNFGDIVTINGTDGIVLYASEDIVYLISVEESSQKWSTESVTTNATDCYYGLKNMETIQAIEGWETKYPAFKWCADLGEGWYLPAYYELRDIYNAKNTLNEALSANGYTTLILSDSWYWSSTESSSGNAYDCTFSSGSYSNSSKSDLDKVHAIYRF